MVKSELSAIKGVSCSRGGGEPKGVKSRHVLHLLCSELVTE